MWWVYPPNGFWKLVLMPIMPMLLKLARFRLRWLGFSSICIADIKSISYLRRRSLKWSAKENKNMYFTKITNKFFNCSATTYFLKILKHTWLQINSVISSSWKIWICMGSKMGLLNICLKKKGFRSCQTFLNRALSWFSFVQNKTN